MSYKVEFQTPVGFRKGFKKAGEIVDQVTEEELSQIKNYVRVLSSVQATQKKDKNKNEEAKK